MSEDERLKTLDDLKESRREINNALERMPIANTSMAIIKKKKEMEEKLMRIDRAIETFSKKTVYIAMWDIIINKILMQNQGFMPMGHMAP